MYFPSTKTNLSVFLNCLNIPWVYIKSYEIKFVKIVFQNFFEMGLIIFKNRFTHEI